MEYGALNLKGINRAGGGRWLMQSNTFALTHRNDEAEEPGEFLSYRPQSLIDYQSLCERKGRVDAEGMEKCIDVG